MKIPQRAKCAKCHNRRKVHRVFLDNATRLYSFMCRECDMVQWQMENAGAAREKNLGILVRSAAEKSMNL